jgi:hypothetical protein
VNTCDVFGVKNSDLVPGKYEGKDYLKLVICSTFCLICEPDNIHGS